MFGFLFRRRGPVPSVPNLRHHLGDAEQTILEARLAHRRHYYTVLYVRCISYILEGTVNCIMIYVLYWHMRYFVTIDNSVKD